MTPAQTEDSNDLHLADLHAQAAAAGIEGFRLLRREELIERLGGEAPAGSQSAGGAASDEDDEDRERPRRRRGRRGGRGRARERLAPEGDERERGDDREPKGETAETEEVTGVLEITRQRHGFLRVPGSEDDVYVSASQVRRCELSDGDEVTGPARAPRRGERHRALVRVNRVNGEDPVELTDAPRRGRRGGGRAEGGKPAGGADLDSLTPAPPSRRIELPEDADKLARAADLLAPLAFGQRVLVRAAPRSGRTTLLRALAQAFEATDGVELTVLLIDERPEEVPAWKEAVTNGDLALAPADLSPAEQTKVATQALDAARAAAAGGADAVLLVDSLTRLAVAADGVAEVKRLFGSGRELAEDGSGSLTVIATVLEADSDEGSAERAVATTETSTIALDASLAEEGIVPALRFAACRAVGVESIISEEEMDGLRHLRSKLSELVPPEAAAKVRELLIENASNEAALKSLA